MAIREDILQIVNNELGQKTCELFEQFFCDSSFEEQYHGAFDIISNTRGVERAKEVLSDVKL